MNFSGILICTDLDGTLLMDDKSISEENLRAIRRFKEGGGYFTFITGRMPYFAKNAYICDAVEPNAPFGCINGGGLYDKATESYVSRIPIKDSVLLLVREAMEAFPEIGVQVNTFEKIYFARDNLANERFRALTGSPDIRAELSEIREPVAKIVFAVSDECEMERLESFLRSHPMAADFDFIRSEETLFEILPKGISKGSALLSLCEHLGIDPLMSLAVGDYNNDVSMLSVAGVGIAVANATDEAKAAADAVTVSNEEHAIARIISDIESGRISFPCGLHGARNFGNL